MRDGQAIAHALGGERNGKGWSFRCPLHDDHKPSASIRDDGLVTCWVCGKERRKELWAKLDELGFTDDGRHIAIDRKKINADHVEAKREARKIWDEAHSCEWSRQFITDYLIDRGITLPVPTAIRLVRDSGQFLAICVTSRSGRVIAVQKKQIRMAFFRKPHFPKRIYTTGRFDSGAVRLGDPKDGVLGLAEGVEDALSAEQLFGVQCWASLGAGRLHEVWLPPDVKEVHVFGDNDKDGREAVRRTVSRHTDEGRRVRVFWPPEKFKDFNDYLLRGAK